MSNKDTYYPQQYKCFKELGGCDATSKHYIWASQADEARHECSCGKQLTYQHMYEPEVVTYYGRVGLKMTSDQIKADRRHRSSQHFQKEIAPTLAKQDRRHFEKKFNKKFGK